MFYPQLSRREAYRSPHDNGGFYADYRAYADEIAKDCQKRCVYCDAKVSENLGGDSFELDHFRPKKHFPDLERDPRNLVLACPACNRFKSGHWPAGTGTADTHVDGCGFVDPFDENRLDYFSINDVGGISAICEPAAYIIELLNLDRAARDDLRRRRLHVKIQKELAHQISRKMQDAIDSISDEKVDKDGIIERLHKLKKLQQALADSLNLV